MKVSCKVEEEDKKIHELPLNVANKQTPSEMDTFRQYIELQPNIQSKHLKPLTT